MFIEFTCANYKSIKDEVCFSLEAANMINPHNNNISPDDLKDNIIIVDREIRNGRGRYQLLTSGVLYGANASGKSNLLNAMECMKRILLSSTSRTEGEQLHITPFLLNPETATSPIKFEIVFLLDSKKYYYGFTANNKQVFSEWLYYTISTQKKPKKYHLFSRENNEYVISDKYIDKKDKRELSKSSVNTNALYLPFCSTINVKIANEFFAWLRKFNIVSGLNEDDYVLFTLQESKYHPFINSIIKRSDFGINSLKIKSEKKNVSKDVLPEEIRRVFSMNIESESVSQISYEVTTKHNIFDDEGKLLGEADFDMSKMESDGTQKMFKLSGPIVDTLQNGGVIVIDELDSSMHPFLTAELIKLFNNKETNPNNAQIIITTHDTNLLSFDLFRKDQIWFTEKDEFGSTDLYCLVEFKDLRKDLRFERNYLKGNFGGIPYPDSVTKLMEVE